MVERELIQQAKSLDMVTIASQYTDIRRLSNQGYHTGCCPKCGKGSGSLVIFPDNRWMCRYCRPTQKGSNDPLDFIRFMHPEYSFSEAVAYLVNLSVEKLQVFRPASQPRQSVDMTAKYQNYRTMATRAFWRLWGNHSSSPVGRSYLGLRGLDLRVCKEWGLGLHWCKQKSDKGDWVGIDWGITLPWKNDQGDVTGLNCRLLNPTKDGQKYQRYGYDQNSVFGIHKLSWYRHHLILVEGELNAVALAHARNEKVDVLSIGSQNHMPKKWIKKAAEWERVWVWLDEQETAEKIASQIPNAIPLASQKDAADFLQSLMIRTETELYRYLQTLTSKDGKRLRYLLLGDYQSQMEETWTLANRLGLAHVLHLVNGL